MSDSILQMLRWLILQTIEAFKAQYWATHSAPHLFILCYIAFAKNKASPLPQKAYIVF